MKVSKGKLLTSFMLASLVLVTGSQLTTTSTTEKNPDAFDCPEARSLELQSAFNALTGKKDTALEDMLEQQHYACDMRGLRMLNTSPGKTYNP